MGVRVCGKKKGKKRHNSRQTSEKKIATNRFMGKSFK